eukprot:38154-Eustigmatos_ZCMA.PRE.1
MLTCLHDTILSSHADSAPDPDQISAASHGRKAPAQKATACSAWSVHCPASWLPHRALQGVRY